MPLSLQLARWRKQVPIAPRLAYSSVKRRLVPHPVYDDPEFRRYYSLLRASEFAGLKELEALQVRYLRDLLVHAYANVPHYRRVMDGLALQPEDFADPRDLARLPVLTKEDVRADPESFIARNWDRAKLRLVSTGGSTPPGPLSLYYDDATAESHEAAFILRQWTDAGYRPGDPLVTLKGQVPAQMDGIIAGAWWDYNADLNELMLSPFDLTEERMGDYVQLLRRFRPRFISAHPRSLEILARYMRRNESGAMPLTAVFLESETIHPWQREVIEAQFRCRVFAGYGQTERVADAVECRAHSGYHVSMEYGIIELVDESGDPITGPGERGYVLGTGFDTYAMPLIRYQTNDVALYLDGECTCGRHSPRIDQIEGKVHQYLVSRGGELKPLFLGHPAVWDKISEWRFVQEEPGVVVAEVVRAPAFGEAEIAADLEREFFRRQHRADFDLQVRFVTSLPRTHRGKLGLLEQRLPVTL